MHTRHPIWAPSTMSRAAAAAALGLGLTLAGCAITVEHHHPVGTDAGMAASHDAAQPDARVAVRFPEPMRTHTLANMRDHLRTISDIQLAIASGAYDKAAKLAEEQLGMTSLAAHGAHQVAQFMPVGMQEIGTLMHRSASRFVTEVQNTAATGDLKPALAALGRITEACVACHAAYRLE